MFNLPELNKKNLENEEIFDVDALPDMDEKSEDEFIDILQERKKLSDVQSKHELTLPKDVSEFKEAYYKTAGNKITLHFKLEKVDLQNMSKVTFGLFSTDVNSGTYEFDIVDTEDEKIKELYYYKEFSGEIMDGEVKIYRRYFFTAIVRSLVQQDILFEYEKNKFTINPVFFVKLQVHSASVAAELSRRGFPIMDMGEYEKMKTFEEEIKKPNQEKKEEADSKGRAKELF
ncbi:MAG: hypothetical protein WCH76_00340 [Candidatus Riflemargulisbacteria bacterium]